MARSEAPIELVASDPSWPALFEHESRELRHVLGAWLTGPIEHIGSTAVPGISAKPVIDIMAGVRDLETSRPAIEAAATLGYCYSPYQPDQRHWFCKPSLSFRTHHLHLVPVDSPQWVRPIAFREYLRAHPDVAVEYESLKRTLASRFRLDREAYTKAKSPFIDAVTEKALASGYGTQPHPRPRRPHVRGILIAVALGSSVSLAQDWESADRATRRLAPAMFVELPAAIRSELESRGCLVPQSFTATRPQNVIKGRFTLSGQTDWAVLCSRQRQSSILVFRGGLASAAEEIATEDDIHSLQTIDGRGGIGYSRTIAVATSRYIKDRQNTDRGSTLPAIDHEGINDFFIEKGSVVWYWYRGRWLKLQGAD